MSDKQCPYELLGVERNADTKTIKKSYRKLMMKYHEDRVTNKVKSDGQDGTPEGNKRIEDAKEMSSSINTAEDILNDTTEYKTSNDNSYTKRETYDKFGHRGLEALKEGNDPAQARASGGGRHSWQEAADVFGGETNATDGLSDDELMGGDFSSGRSKRSVDDILKGAKHSLDNEFADIDELLDQSRRGGSKKKPKKDKKSDGSSIGDITNKLGGLFSRAKETVEEFIPEKPANAIQNSDELALRLQAVAEEIAKVNGDFSPMLQKALVQELAEIASEVQAGGQQPQNNKRFRP